jgi:transcriptional regulator with XRE-family HTH domain
MARRRSATHNPAMVEARSSAARAVRERPPTPTPFGELLRDWRQGRRLSQLELSLQADISARHLSYVENGRSRPSRDMVSRLADVLDVSLRDRNLLLVAAGYAPTHGETDLNAPQLGAARTAVDLILRHQDPYPALVLDRGWNALLTNRAAQQFMRLMGLGHSTERNVIRLIMDPAELRPRITNWEAAAGDLVRQLQRQVAAGSTDDPAHRLLDDVLAYPDVPAAWRTHAFHAASQPFMSVSYRSAEGVELRFFTTITSFAAAYDITLEELRVECSFPADEETAELCRKLLV